MKVRLGKVMLTPKGVYSSSATYSRLDLVIKDDCAYVSLAEDNTGHSLTDENYWMLLLDGAFTRRYYEQNGITVASIICNGNATIGGNLTINGSIISPDLQAKINALNSSINNNSSRINALTTRVTALENNSGGGGGGSVDPAVIAQLRSEINAKVDITYFNRLFQAYNGTSPVFPNDGTTTINNIKALHDFWSAGSVTALGYNSGGSGGGGGGVEYLSLLSDVSLTSPSDGQALVYDATLGKWKNGSVIPSGSFATESWVTTQLSNYYTKSQTEQKIADAISQSGGFDPTKYYLKTETYSRQEVDNALNGYLPTTGGTITGNLTVSGSKLHLGQHTSLENYNGAIFSLPSKGVNTSWTLATTSDIPDISTLVTKDYFRTLFTPIDAQGQVIAATDTTTPIASIRANYDFWSTGAVSAYGTSSSGGGQGAQLGALLTSLNNSGLAAPTSSEIGKTIVWGDNGWEYGTVSGGSSGITLSDVRSDLQSTTPAYKINAAHIPDLSGTYLPLTGGRVSGMIRFGSGSNNYIVADSDNEYIEISGSESIELANDTNVTGRVVATSFVKSGGTSAQFLKADGSVDPYTYVKAADAFGDEIHLSYYEGEDAHYISLNDLSSGHITFTSGTTDIGPNSIVTNSISASSMSATGGSIQIGDGFLIWDSVNNAIKVQKANGASCDFYSTGAISALGTGSSSSGGGISGKVYTIGDNTDTLYCDGSAISGFSDLLENDTYQSVLVYNNNVYRLRAISDGASTNISINNATRLYFSNVSTGSQQIFCKEIVIRLTSNDAYTITIQNSTMDVPYLEFNSSTSTLNIG